MAYQINSLIIKNKNQMDRFEELFDQNTELQTQIGSMEEERED